MRKLEVLVDAREQRPLPLPARFIWHSTRWDRPGTAHQFRVIPIVGTLAWGDYCLKGFERGCVVERKGSLEEVQQNLMSKDRPRFLKALTRLVDNCAYPILLLDFSIRRSQFVPEPDRVLDELYRTCAAYGVHPVRFAGASVRGRLQSGSQMVRLLWNYDWIWRQDITRTRVTASGETLKGTTHGRDKEGHGGSGSDQDSVASTDHCDRGTGAGADH